MGGSIYDSPEGQTLRVGLLENMEMINSTPTVISWYTNICDPSKPALRNNFPLWEWGGRATQTTGLWKWAHTSYRSVLTGPLHLNWVGPWCVACPQGDHYSFVRQVCITCGRIPRTCARHCCYKETGHSGSCPREACSLLGRAGGYPRMSIIWTMAGNPECSGMSWAAPKSQTWRVRRN